MVFVVVPTGNTTWADLPFLFVCFAFYTGVPFPFLCPCVDFYFWDAGLSSRPIPRVVGSCWKGVWAWAWVCQTPNSVLLCWLLFPDLARYTRLAPFFGHLMKCRGGGRPRQWPSSVWATILKINWAWAEATLSLAPQVHIAKCHVHFSLGNLKKIINSVARFEFGRFQTNCAQ